MIRLSSEQMLDYDDQEPLSKYESPTSLKNHSVGSTTDKLSRRGKENISARDGCSRSHERCCRPPYCCTILLFHSRCCTLSSWNRDATSRQFGPRYIRPSRSFVISENILFLKELSSHYITKVWHSGKSEFRRSDNAKFQHPGIFRFSAYHLAFSALCGIYFRRFMHTLDKLKFIERRPASFLPPKKNKKKTSLTLQQ